MTKTIVIGNLALGGTGKTPHADYILKLLAPSTTALLSRGYGRKGSGFKAVHANSHPDDVGDEPLLLAIKNPKVLVVVDEDRLHGIASLKTQFPERKTILLDDALQHRKLRGGLNVLLTTWQRPFTDDMPLPAGKLRDHAIRARDAQAIVVSKTPEDYSPAEREAMAKKFDRFDVPTFFSSIRYGRPALFSGKENVPAESIENILLISAIADASLFDQEARKRFKVKKHFEYRDHHRFTQGDLKRIRDFIGSFAPGTAAVLTTEKDAVRLMPLITESQDDNILMYCWEIRVDFGDDAAKFEKLITTYVES
jgi:tetraacyldisaccharide 4'-kinase